MLHRLRVEYLLRNAAHSPAVKRAVRCTTEPAKCPMLCRTSTHTSGQRGAIGDRSKIGVGDGAGVLYLYSTATPEKPLIFATGTVASCFVQYRICTILLPLCLCCVHYHRSYGSRFLPFESTSFPPFYHNSTTNPSCYQEPGPGPRSCIYHTLRLYYTVLIRHIHIYQHISLAPSLGTVVPQQDI
jgi:hypothetical protein